MSQTHELRCIKLVFHAQAKPKPKPEKKCEGVWDKRTFKKKVKPFTMIYVPLCNHYHIKMQNIPVTQKNFPVLLYSHLPSFLTTGNCESLLCYLPFPECCTTEMPYSS